MPFSIGENVGPYRIVEQLGRGGMATVFKAYHPALDRYVAIKGMHRVFTEDPNFLARFQREARVVARLEHPNIVPVYDFAEHNGQPYLVMKFIEGETLKARLSKGPLSKQDILAVVQAVGSALAYAHGEGILHRDIKPSNVLLEKNGGIFLTDFGLARIAQAGESTLSADMMLGTPQYISPEQAIGKKQLDEGTDIYSFGVMLYELVVGEVPFSADTPYSIIHDHIYTPLPLPHVKKGSIIEPVERVLLKVLAKKREDRYPTVAALVDAFSKAMQDQPTGATPVPGQLKQPPAPTPVVSPMNLQPVPEEHAESPPVVEEPSSDLPMSPELAEEVTPLLAGEQVPVPQTGEFLEAAAPTVVAGESEISGGVKKKKKRSRWWWAVPIGLLVCVCGLLILASADNRKSVDPTQPVGTPAPLDTEPPPREEPTIEPLPSGSPIDDAIRKVDANPDDPFAYLELAAAFADAGRGDDAAAEFDKAMELGGEDVNFLRTAGDFLYERQVWLEAAELFVAVARLENGVLPFDLVPKLERSLFNAAIDPRLADSGVLHRDTRIKGLNPLIKDIVTIRYQLHNGGSPEEAEAALEALLTEHPDYPPAYLLQADIAIQVGKIDKAKLILGDIIKSERPGSWVLLEARRMMFELNRGG